MSFLEELAARRRFGIRPGLETIASLCDRLGNPQRNFRAVHVAGTNGKGAVCAILEAALAAAEASAPVGRYTSPHLVRLNERFLVGGVPADDAELDRLAAEVAKVAPPQLTFFEALTAVAFRLFSERGVGRAVMECGLGGRLDATNVCVPELSVITRIGLDHCDWLGDTLEKIAAEKAGIVRRGVSVVLGRNAPEVVRVVRERAAALDAPFHYAPDLADESEVPADFSLRGAFNRENAVTALAAMRVLGLKGGLPHAVVWPGRFQAIGRFIVDGAHNPPAAEALVRSLSEFGGGRYELVFGACADKDVGTVLRTLGPVVSRAFAVKTVNPRSLAAADLAETMRRSGIAEACPCESLAAALDATRGPTLVCGSLFLAGEALVALGAYPWENPRFDPSERYSAAESSDQTR